MPAQRRHEAHCARKTQWAADRGPRAGAQTDRLTNIEIPSECTELCIVFLYYAFFRTTGFGVWLDKQT